MAEKKYLGSEGLIRLAANVLAKLQGYVPTSRTVNGKALSEDITLSYGDVGADQSGAAASALTSAKSYTDEQIESVTNGDVTVAEATHASTATSATSATTATSATKATQDGSGNVIVDTYETKVDSAAKLDEAKDYADGIKNDLLNGAGEAYDTLKELGDLINENTTALDALETVAAGKADASHTHTVSEVTDLTATAEELNYMDGVTSNVQTQLDTKATMFGYTATSTDGVAYTATVDGITELVAGIHFTIVPSMTSTSITPTLDVNGLGAAMLRTRVSGNTATTAAAVNANWLSTGKPVEVVYDGRWWMVNFIRPNAPDLYGKVAIANGGTNATTVEAARTNLEVYSKTEVDDLLSNAGGQVQFITWESTD